MVTHAFPKFDLSTIINNDNEEEEEEEAIEGATKVRVDLVDTKEVAPEVTTEVEASIEETIAKVITDTKAMINKEVEAFEVAQTTSFGK